MYGAHRCRHNLLCSIRLLRVGQSEGSGSGIGSEAMYHPSRGGVRGGRDQFAWEDVKVDKHRENYLGHSVKAPVGRWQKGKDLHWYARDKKSQLADAEAMKEEIRRIKEQEEQAMREALGLTSQRASRPQTNRLDKHEMKELVKRASTAEDLGAGHAEAAHVQGLGYARLPRPWEESSSAQPHGEEFSAPVARVDPADAERNQEPNDSEDERGKKKRRREVKTRERHENHEKRHARDSGDRKHRKHDKKKG